MSPDSPPSPEGYLHKVLVNGITPFHYRSGVRSLLGMSDATTDSPISASLPSIEFLYAILPAIAAMGESDRREVEGRGQGAEGEDAGMGRRGDVGTSAVLKVPLAQQSAFDELEVPTQQATRSTQEAQHAAFHRSEPVQRSPLSSAAGLVSSEVTEAITPSGNCEAIVPPTKPEAFSEVSSSQPTPIAIPGVTEQRFSPIDPLQVVPELLQPDRADELQPSETNSQLPSSLHLPLNQPELWVEHPSSPSTLYSGPVGDEADGTELPTQQTTIQPSIPRSQSSLATPEPPLPETNPAVQSSYPSGVIVPTTPLAASEKPVSQMNSGSQSLPFTVPAATEVHASDVAPLPVKLMSSHATIANVASQIYPVSEPSIEDTLLQRAGTRADYPDRVSDPTTVTARSRQHTNSTPNRLKLNPTSSVEQPQVTSPDVNVTPAVAASVRPQAGTGAMLSAPIPPASVSITEDGPTPLSRAILQPRPAIAPSDRPAIASPTTPKLAEEIIKLRRMIADLEAQVTAQKNFQQPPSPRFAPPPVQPVKVVERSPQAAQTNDQPAKAYWERSYMSRLYRWSRR